MVRNGVRKPIGRTRAMVYAVLVHVVIIGLLLLSFRWHSENDVMQAPKMIEAHVVDATAASRAAQKLKQRLAQQELARQKQQLQQQELRQQQQLRQQQALQQQLRQQQQQQALQQQLRQQLALARERQQKREVERKAAVAAKLRAAALEKARLAAVKKQQQLAEKRRRQRAIASLQRQLAEEQAHRAAAAAAAAAAAKAQSAIARYKVLIRQKVEQNWVRPLDTRKGMKCVVRVKLVQGGDVLEAEVVQSSGDPVFDRSVENAVYRASPLPLPDDSTLFPYFRELEFTFKPES